MRNSSDKRTIAKDSTTLRSESLASNGHTRPRLSDRQAELIKSLRSEAFDVKDCFTRYSIQSIGFVVVGLAFIVRFQLDSFYMTLALLPVIVLLSAVGRMGTHKYAAACRLAGYELHLQRTSRLSKDAHYEWKQDWADLGWEEAMRAWRVVQATVYQHVYIGPRDYKGLKAKLQPKYRLEKLLPSPLYGRWKQDELRPEFLAKRKDQKALWFEPKSLFGARAAYYPGGYLGTMLNVIHAATGLCIAFLFLTPFLALEQKSSFVLPGDVAIATFVLFSVTFVVILIHSKQLYERLQVIENGMLSIHSCAILWHATVIAHFRAAEALERTTDGIQFYEGYTKALSEHAADLAENVLEIHEWMKPSRGDLPHRSRETTAR